VGIYEVVRLAGAVEIINADAVEINQHGDLAFFVKNTVGNGGHLTEAIASGEWQKVRRVGNVAATGVLA